MRNHILIFKSSFQNDLQEIQNFFEAFIGVKIVADLYLEKIIREIEVLQNPLIKGELVNFGAAQFQKIPIMHGRFIIFFLVKDDVKEFFYIKSTKMNYHASIR